LVREKGRTFSQVKAVNLFPLNIRHINFTTSNTERNKLVQYLKALVKDGNFDEVFFQLEKCLPKDKHGNFITEQENSDVVHDLLVFLAQQMMETNREKQSEIKSFLEWLEGYIGVKIDKLKSKTKIRSYFESSWRNFLEVLKQNKRKIKNLDITRREPQEKIKAEYEASQAKLTPLLSKIESTDNLIDQIVYKLYGLTEEEIEIVEET